MSVIPITCDNCGAKYRLPETFTGTQAKCQKCGSVIDVAKQRGASDAPAAAKPAAAKPAAARPAAARPAVDRSKTERPSDTPKPSARPARSERAAKRGAKADAGDDGDDKSSRARRESAKKKNNTMMLAGSAIGLVAIIVVVVIMMNSGKKPANTTDTAKVEPKPTVEATAPKETPPPPIDKPADKPTETPTDTTPKPADKPAAKPTAKPAAKPAEPVAPAVPDDPNHVKLPFEKMRNPPQSMDQVTDPKTYAEVQWPAEIDDATKKEIQGLAVDAAGDGIVSQRAKIKLEKIGYGALFGIVERLRLLDYKDPPQEMVAFDLNKLLDRITGGLNVRFEPVEITESLVPAKVEWNTRTVNAWINQVAKYPTSELFKTDRAERLKKQAESEK